MSDISDEKMMHLRVLYALLGPMDHVQSPCGCEVTVDRVMNNVDFNTSKCIHPEYSGDELP